tara:strand:+ start:1633 stop:2754 length:1122 start_codon:yes stop_codon:yes gene_type:complete
MKILFPLLAFYPSQVGGPANTIYWLTNELNKKGVNTTIVTTCIGINSEIQKNKFINQDNRKIFYGSRNQYSLKTLCAAISEIKKNDVIHINGLFEFIAIIVFFWTKIFHPSKLIVISPRGGLNHSALSYSSFKKKIIIFLYRFFLKNDLIHATSDSEIKDIARQFNSKNIFLLPNFISPEKKINNIKIKKQLLFLGRIHPIKALDNLIDAISLSDFFISKGYKLKIVGAYEDRFIAYYESLCKKVDKLKLNEIIEFSGHIEGELKHQILAESYALVLPSHSENFGNVVLESLNQGTPIIASKGTPWSVLEKEKAGYHIVNEPKILAKSIDSIISLDSEEYNNLRENSMALLNKRFNIELNIDKWIKKYNFESN